METPRYYECMNPILTALRQGGGTLTNDEIVDVVATIMHLPDDVMNRKQQGHTMGEVAYRIAWAKSYLKKAGYLTQSTRGVWALTAEGTSADAVDVRAILTDVRKDYVTRRTEKVPPPPYKGSFFVKPYFSVGCEFYKPSLPAKRDDRRRCKRSCEGHRWAFHSTSFPIASSVFPV